MVSREGGPVMDGITMLLSAFVLSVAALAFFIWSMRRGGLDSDPRGAKVIFEPSEVGHPEDPSSRRTPAADLAPVEFAERTEADRSSAPVTFIFLCCAIVWLLVASAAGLTASIKLHSPDWLTQYEWLSFGRVRTLHLNALAYGWAPMAGLGLAIWLLPRLLKTT